MRLKKISPSWLRMFSLWMAISLSTGVYGQWQSGQDSENIADKHFKHDSSDLKLGWNYFKNYFVDAGNILISPLRWKKKNWLHLTAVGGTTALLLIVDDEINDWVQDHQSNTVDNIESVVEPLGNDKYLMPAAASIPFYVYGALAGDIRATHTALLGLESFFLVGGLTQVLKRVTNRKRPNDRNSRSFPSGHSSTLFALAAIIDSEFEGRVWISSLAYSVAGLSAISRVYSESHWASDVFFGAALGFFMGKTLYKLHHLEGKEQITLAPVSENGAKGLALIYKF